MPFWWHLPETNFANLYSIFLPYLYFLQFPLCDRRCVVGIVLGVYKSTSIVSAPVSFPQLFFHLLMRVGYSHGYVRKLGQSHCWVTTTLTNPYLVNLDSNLFFNFSRVRIYNGRKRFPVHNPGHWIPRTKPIGQRAGILSILPRRCLNIRTPRNWWVKLIFSWNLFKMDMFINFTLGIEWHPYALVKSQYSPKNIIFKN